MKVGDLVIRKIPKDSDYPSFYEKQNCIDQRRRLGHGLVLSAHMSGSPAHPCVSVYYPKTGQVYDIAHSFVEVVSESR